MIKPRTLSAVLRKAVKTFPAVVLTGPRQSGKTTLLKAIFSKTHGFVSLENPDVRLRAKEDPIGFLETYPPPVILDEIQYVPELLSYLKTKIDARRKPGQWLLTGSQNFVLMHGASQSLAGRAAVLSLLPFSLAERAGFGDRVLEPQAWVRKLKMPADLSVKFSLPEIILRGNYPEIAAKKKVDKQLWCGSYISTYLERDVRHLAQIGDLTQFENFLKICASRTGQLFHFSDIAREVGVSVPTVRRWISILETGYQVLLVYPYFKNLGKRLVKAPKLYWMDTGLASYLLGIHDEKTLMSSPLLGGLFETMVVTDMHKRFLHAGRMPSLYCLRTQDGLEVDAMMDVGQKLHFFEIKSTMTILPKHAAPIKKIISALGAKAGDSYVVSRSKENYSMGRGVSHVPWEAFSRM